MFFLLVLFFASSPRPLIKEVIVCQTDTTSGTHTVESCRMERNGILSQILNIWRSTGEKRPKNKAFSFSHLNQWIS